MKIESICLVILVNGLISCGGEPPTASSSAVADAIVRLQEESWPMGGPAAEWN